MNNNYLAPLLIISFAFPTHLVVEAAQISEGVITPLQQKHRHPQHCDLTSTPILGQTPAMLQGAGGGLDSAGSIGLTGVGTIAFEEAEKADRELRSLRGGRLINFRQNRLHIQNTGAAYQHTG